jgi:hypothetical protein
LKIPVVPQVVLLELCSERRGILTMTKEQARTASLFYMMLRMTPEHS